MVLPLGAVTVTVVCPEAARARQTSCVRALRTSSLAAAACVRGVAAYRCAAARAARERLRTREPEAARRVTRREDLQVRADDVGHVAVVVAGRVAVRRRQP